MNELIFENNDDLPTGWIESKLNDVCELIGGGTPSRNNSEYFDGDIVWLTPTEIPKNTIVRIKDSKEKITELGLKKSSAKIIPKESVLLTSRASIGYVAIADRNLSTNQGFASFICTTPLFNYYLAYWLWGNKKILESEATGTTFKEISKSKLRNLVIPLPPLNEQKRIIAKIEELFLEVQTIVDFLLLTKTKIEIAQKSLLISAFEGDLTSSWRDKDQNNSSSLKSKILEKEETFSKVKKVSKIILNNLPSLPDNWVWSRMMIACKKVTDGTHFSPPNSKKGDFPYITAKNIRAWGVDLTNLTYVSQKIHSEIYTRCNPEKAGILKNKKVSCILHMQSLCKQVSDLLHHLIFFVIASITDLTKKVFKGKVCLKLLCKAAISF